MEKKTLGAFLAVLRKAKGVTQKELAELVGVSDKTISHWERDESAPDVSVLPVLADLFGVTVDELLRGERNAAGETAGGTLSQKSEKQLQYLMEKNFHKFKNAFWIAMCTVVIGLLLAFTLYDRFALSLGAVSLLFLTSALVFLLLKAGNYSFTLKEDAVPNEYRDLYRKKLKCWTLFGVLVIAAPYIFMLLSLFIDVLDSFLVEVIGVILPLLCVGTAVILLVKNKDVFFSKK